MKIINQFPECEVYNVVTRVHNQEDVEEGDITERLEQSKYYNHVLEYNLQMTDYRDYSVDQDTVDDYIYEIESGNAHLLPKIVLNKDGEVVDGVHRIHAYLSCGITSVDLLRGTDKKLENNFKKELVDKNLNIYKISNEMGSISIMENAKYSPANNSISEFIVNEKYRNLGVGTALLKEAMIQYGELGAQVSSPSSLKVFLECGFEPSGLKNTGKFDISTTSFDFKTFNKNPDLAENNLMMYRRTIESFRDRLEESIVLFNENQSLYLGDTRPKPKPKLNPSLKTRM